MPDDKFNHYNPNHTYKKKSITIDKSTISDYPMLEATDNAALFPESIKNNIDQKQLKPFH
jgi:hypothetical protein